jgi:hypothetical protein
LKTPIDWFVEATTRQQSENDYFELIDKANEMFKAAIIEACESTLRSVKLDETKEGFFAKTGEGYYKENYEL